MLQKNLRKKCNTIIFSIICSLMLAFITSFNVKADSYAEINTTDNIRVFSSSDICFVAGNNTTIQLDIKDLNTDTFLYATNWHCSNSNFTILGTGIGTCTLQQSTLAKANTETDVYCSYNGNDYSFRLSIIDNQKRTDAVNYMYQMATVEWKAPYYYMYYTKYKNKPTQYYFKPNYTYYGIPYTNRYIRMTSNLENFESMGLDQNRTLLQVDDAYMGNDCISALSMSWNYALYGNTDTTFYKYNTYYASPTTKIFMHYLSAENNSQYAVSILLSEATLASIRDATGMSLRKNLNLQKYDTRLATNSDEKLERGKYEGKTVSEMVYASYKKLKIGDAVIRHIFSNTGITGHIMMVRSVDENGVYFIDQYGINSTTQTNNNQILPGESTFETYHYYTYDSLMQQGYIPIRLGGIDQ